MSWLQIRLAITPDQAEALEDQLLDLGAVSVTFMDAEDQPIFEPDLNTTPLWSHTHLLALFEADTDPDSLLAHLQLLRGGELPEHQVEVIEDQDWERSWMDNFQPMRFGRRTWIGPWDHALPEDAAAPPISAEGAALLDALLPLRAPAPAALDRLRSMAGDMTPPSCAPLMLVGREGERRSVPAADDWDAIPGAAARAKRRTWIGLGSSAAVLTLRPNNRTNREHDAEPNAGGQ